MNDNLENKGNSSLKFLWVLNIVLLIGLAVLYSLYLSERKKPHATAVSHQVPVFENQGELRLAYVDSDVLMERYEKVADFIKEFEASTISKEAEIRAKQNDFERQVKEFQDRLQSGNISMEIAQITEQQLMRDQQALVDLRDQLSEQLAREEFEMNMQLIENVTTFLEGYNRTKNYDLIFNFKQGTNLFIANQAFDITPEVIELLNQEYRLRKPRK